MRDWIREAARLAEVSYEPEHPYKDDIAVPMMDRSYSDAKRNGIKRLGKIGPFDLVSAKAHALDDPEMLELFLVNNAGNPRGEFMVSSPRDRGARTIFSVYLMLDARGNGYKLYCFLLDHGFTLRTGKSHTEDSRRMWIKLAADPRYDVRMNWDKEVTTPEDVDLAYTSPLYFLTAIKA